MLQNLKYLAERVPEGIGRPLARLPYCLRLGPAYSIASREIRWFERYSVEEGSAVLLAHLRGILEFAYREIPFYRNHYDGHGFHPDHFRAIEDWQKVPVVTKTDLQQVPLGQRVSERHRGIKINTGGSSGAPLEFYIDRRAFAREWAHMHRIWMARGYRPNHLKLTFRGKHFDESEPIRYNAVHNEYVANSNCSMEQIADSLEGLGKYSIIRWIHGYPSLVAEFASHLAERTGGFMDFLRERLYGVLLGSEYPAPHYRKKIEEVLSGNIVSWYGHSEMAILAGESTQGVYTSLPSYGYAEAVERKVGSAQSSHLVATSFRNLAHPFIRYDTGDLIKPVGGSGGSLSFSISEGRIGDFVTARDGRRIALTALIFGRHHPAFANVRYLQVREDCPGRITLLAVPSDGIVKEQIQEGFDLADSGLEWQVEIIREPFRTPQGKTPLKVSSTSTPSK